VVVEEDGASVMLPVRGAGLKKEEVVDDEVDSFLRASGALKRRPGDTALLCCLEGPSLLPEASFFFLRGLVDAVSSLFLDAFVVGLLGETTAASDGVGLACTTMTSAGRGPSFLLRSVVGDFVFMLATP
jgi:hypothetical protein